MNSFLRESSAFVIIDPYNFSASPKGDAFLLLGMN